MKEKKPPLPTRLHYKFDSFLLYLIQENTKRSSAEVLNFFNELGKQVADIGSENRTGKGIRKNITNYFPGTAIPFNMTVKGYKRNLHWNPQTRRYEEVGEVLSCNIEVGFPDKKMSVKTQDLDSIAVSLMEKALLGGEDPNIPPFAKPEIKTPKMYKALMEAFTKGKIDE